MRLHSADLAELTTNFPGAGSAIRSEPLTSYTGAIRAHKLLIAIVTAATVLGALLWLVAREEPYESNASLLVSPVAQNDPLLLGLPVIRDTPGEPTRSMQTAAALVETPAVAAAAATALGEGWSPGRAASAVKVEPQGQSNILSITGTGPSPEESARIATEYANAALAVRKEVLGEAATIALDGLPADSASGSTESPFASVAERRAALESIRDNGDPSLQLSQEGPPGEQTGPSAILVLMLALFGGVALGIAAAIVLEMLDRAVRDENEALSLYPLPILTRVPVLSRRQRRAGRDRVWYMPPSVREAYRTATAQVPASTGSEGVALMVTSASHGDGKTTSAVNLATSLAAADKSVVLLDFDLRKPSVAAQLGLRGSLKVTDLLQDGRKLDSLMLAVPQLPTLRVLSPASGSNDPRDLDAISARLPSIVEAARGLADWVIVDTAPLGEVSDALRVTRAVDDIVVVVRPGRTSRLNFEMMRDLLERMTKAPLGLIVIGQPAGLQSSPYAYGASKRELFKSSAGVS
jgi:Mrp family chromosome partitioning ATPase/capsular polysaccharide biosynthesis protein